MCFQMTQHVERVEDPDYKDIFRVFEAGRRPDEKELLDYVKTAGKIAIANAIVGKVIEVAEGNGRIQSVKQAIDIPTMFDRGVLFVSKSLNRFLVDVAHPETTWESQDVRLQGKAIMLQLKDFSYVAQVSFGIPDNSEYPQHPVAENELIRREVRIKFNLDVDTSVIYTVPDGWVMAEMDRIRYGR